MTNSADYSWADITQLSWGTATKVTNHDWADRLQVADRFVVSWHMATEPALDNWTDRLQVICKAWNGQYPTHVSICLFSGHLSVIAWSHVWRFWKMSWDHCCHGWPISRASHHILDNFFAGNTNFLNRKLRLQIHNSVKNKCSQILKQTAPLFFSPELLKGSFGLPMSI